MINKNPIPVRRISIQKDAWGMDLIALVIYLYLFMKLPKKIEDIGSIKVFVIIVLATFHFSIILGEYKTESVRK